MTDNTPARRQCRAHNRAGEQCKKPPILGGFTCATHGSAAPQVKRKAAERLAALIDPAITALAKEMADADASRDRIAAANSILDRAGITKGGGELDLETARLALVERLIALREEQRAATVTTVTVIDEEPDNA